MNIQVDQLIIRSFIDFNRFYDEMKKTYPEIDDDKTFCDLGDCLEMKALAELLKGYPKAKERKNLSREIMYDIVDAETLKTLSSEQLASEYLSYFIGEYESRTDG